MSFVTTLKIDGKDFDVIACSYTLERDISTSGAPVSGVRGGVIKLKIKSLQDSFFAEWMAKPYLMKSGKIQFWKRDTDVPRELHFEDAYLVHYKEKFKSTGEAYLVESMAFSARLIIVNGIAIHENIWPM